MAQRPTFGMLRKNKPAVEAPPLVKDNIPAIEPEQATRIQTSVRLDPAMWAALNDLATRKRVETGRRVTMHDLLIEGGRHVLAINGIKLSE